MVSRCVKFFGLLALGWCFGSAPVAADEMMCAEEEALSEAAASLALTGRIDAESLQAALSEADSDLMHAWARRFSSPTEVGAWLDQRETDAPLVCGIAHSAGGVVVVAAARAGFLSVRATVVSARVSNGFQDPHLVVHDAEGGLHRFALDGSQRVDLAELPVPLVVQLVATGPRGPRPVAQRHIAADTIVHARESVESRRSPSFRHHTTRSEPPGAGFDAEGSVRHRLDSLREAHDVSPLRANRLLEQAARHHAFAVCRAGVAAHHLDHTDPTGRLRAQGIEARVVGETVARIRRGEDPIGALMASPGHLATLVDARFTDGGIGQARFGARECTVVLLAAWPRYVGRR